MEWVGETQSIPLLNPTTGVGFGGVRVKPITVTIADDIVMTLPELLL